MQITAASTRSLFARKGGKYLIFVLGAEDYAIPVLKVREIVKIQHITAVPDTPAAVKGVINLRGKVIPVIDLRLKFGLPELSYGERTCIIVVQLADSTTALVGVVVDEVSEVLSLQDDEIQHTPEFGSTCQTPFLLGMAKVKDKVKILLDIERVLSFSDIYSSGVACR